jgi:hypothetical protein
MPTIEITEAELKIHMHGLDKLWALRGELAIPLAHVHNVEVRPEDADIWKSHAAFRVGSYMPGYVTAGYYYCPKGMGANAAKVVSAISALRASIDAWPEDAATPREGSHKARALEHLGHVDTAMRAAMEAAGARPEDDGSGWAFYDVHDRAKTIGFDVEGQKIRRVVIQIDEGTPEDAAERIRKAIGRA